MRKNMTERNDLVGKKENYSADFLNRTKSKRNNVKGITLIALVITIIVLLILAGVTINAITGNESAMEKAQQARSENEQADELDSIKLAVVDAVAKGDNGKVNKDKLAESLEGLIEGNIEGGDTNPWTVKGKITGKKYTITENGNVTEEEVGKTLTEEEKKERQTAINAKIGADVEGYTTASDGETGGWRVYYASTDEVFLIFNDEVPSETAFGGDDGIPLKDEYSGSNAISEYGKNYNPMWFEKLKDQAEDKNNNAKATAYLCDPANWEKYISTDAPEGTYAVGGPTKELFLLSWNESLKNGKLGEEETKKGEQSLADEDVTENGYNYKRPSHMYNDDPVKKEKIGDICDLYNNGKSYWLASPGSDDAGDVCFVFGSGCVSCSTYDNADGGVRPLVSIPISKVQIDNEKVKIVP